MWLKCNSIWIIWASNCWVIEKYCEMHFNLDYTSWKTKSNLNKINRVAASVQSTINDLMHLFENKLRPPRVQCRCGGMLVWCCNNALAPCSCLTPHQYPRWLAAETRTRPELQQGEMLSVAGQPVTSSALLLQVEIFSIETVKHIFIIQPINN